MKQLRTKILKNEEIRSGFFRMRIASAYIAREAQPGQFVEIRCGERTDPLLRRPLGINRVLKGGIELLYEVVGQGTELISCMKRGEPVEKALKRLKKIMDKEGLMKQLRANRYFEKPSEKKRRKSARARARAASE